MADNEYVLSQDILDRCLERAPGYDRENRFFTEDFEELRDAGYLTMPVPKELGGTASRRSRTEQVLAGRIPPHRATSIESFIETRDKRLISNSS